MLCIGHRGAMGHEPENTLRSVNKALELGVNAIEIDVRNIEDNLLVIHDRDLSRTTNGRGYIEDFSFAYLRSLDAGKGEIIPTLKEVCDTVNRQAIINIELKGHNTARLTVDLIHDYISRGWSYEDFVVSSFNHYELKQLQVIDPQITIGILIYGLPWKYLETAGELSATIIIVNLDYVSPELVQAVQQQNLFCWVYTVNHQTDIELMRQLKVDGVVTNYPELVGNSTNREFKPK